MCAAVKSLPAEVLFPVALSCCGYFELKIAMSDEDLQTLIRKACSMLDSLLPFAT